MEFLVTLLIAALLIRLFKMYYAPSKNGTSFFVPRDATALSGIPRNVASMWVSPGRVFIARGFEIKDGMVYVGSRMRDFTGANDACLIDPSLPAALDESQVEPIKDAMPRYETLTPGQRAGYLDWLARGRSGPADVAWLFLFFYGVERRLFVDSFRGAVPKQERDALVDEVIRLSDIYCDHRSFRGYCKNLLATSWAQRGVYAYIPDYIDFTDRFCVNSFNSVFSLFVSRGQPIPGEVALQWLFLHPEYLPGTALRRAPDIFEVQFLRAYRERFGEGVFIHNNRTPLGIIYKGANPSFGNGVKVSISSLPDPFLLATPLKSIRALGEECVAAMKDDQSLDLGCPRRGGGGQDLLDSLDDTHREFMACLAAKPLWPRREVLAICNSLSILPDPSIELLNSWASVNGGISLVEDGDPLFVDVSLLEEILVRGRSSTD